MALSAISGRWRLAASRLLYFDLSPEIMHGAEAFLIAPSNRTDPMT